VSKPVPRTTHSRPHAAAAIFLTDDVSHDGSALSAAFEWEGRSAPARAPRRIVEAACSDEVITRQVVATLDERNPRSVSGRVSPSPDRIEVIAREFLTGIRGSRNGSPVDGGQDRARVCSGRRLRSRPHPSCPRPHGTVRPYGLVGGRRRLWGDTGVVIASIGQTGSADDRRRQHTSDFGSSCVVASEVNRHPTIVIVEHGDEFEAGSERIEVLPQR
jgi:hypothetical protein